MLYIVVTFVLGLFSFGCNGFKPIRSRGDFGLHKLLATSSPSHPTDSRRSQVLAAMPNPVGSDIAIAILAPSSLGFWKREYGVSYGYGLSVAGAAYSALLKASTPLGRTHALIHIVYGLRLSAFLFFRESTVPRFKKLKQKIEENAPPNRVARTPFIVSCAALYWWMSFPVFITSSLAKPLVRGSLIANAVNGCLVVAAMGLAIQITGDTQKYIEKRKDEKSLVTGGVYSIFRHPNYTGELILWSFSSLAGILSATSAFQRTWRALLMSVGSILGAAGIAFILALAATGLEKRQLEEYGHLDAFKEWRKRAWSGLTLPSASKEARADGAHVSNELDAEEQNC